MSSKRPAVVLSTLLVGVGAGLAAAVVSARRSAPAAPAVAPVGRVGEPGPQWGVEESVVVHRPAGEVAQALHEHGGLPGLDGVREGPAMDKIAWDVDGAGHFEVDVHGLPGADRTRITVRVAAEQTGVAGAAHAARAAVLGTSVRSQVRSDLDALRRRLEGSPSGGTPRAASAGSASDHA